MLVLISMNEIAHAPESGDALALIKFGQLGVLSIVCSRYAHHRTIALIESGLHRIRVRIVDKVTRIDLAALERANAAEIYDRITQNCTQISDKANFVVGMMLSSVVLAFSFLYIASLSLSMFALIGLLCLSQILLFLDIRRKIDDLLRATGKVRVVFLERLTDLLLGFKQLKFSRRSRRDFHEHIELSSDALCKSAIKSSDLLSLAILQWEIFRFALLGAVVFSVRVSAHFDEKPLTAIVMAVSFLFGPLLIVMRGLPRQTQADLALEEIALLEQKLDAGLLRSAVLEEAVDPWKCHITKIEAIDLEYEYTGENGLDKFRIGPIRLEFRAGETTFVVGGNGSGKSTLLKVLTGLVASTQGTLLADGVPIGRENVASFRDMVSAIFGDFHLFPSLYGLGSHDGAVLKRLIAQMRLEKQTSYVNRAFTKIKLSTGERKRLAMIVTLLEDRPICVFDEWAAEQDPEFRAYFYEVLLPQLRDDRKIVIVVSHDDRYFHCADQLVTMEEGKVRSVHVRASQKEDVA